MSCLVLSFRTWYAHSTCSFNSWRIRYNNFNNLHFLDVSEQKDEQLRSIQEQCFQEVEELKAVLMSERTLKLELAEELDVREKRLQQTTVEIQALSSLKAGLEGSLQTSNARANDEKVKYEREMSLRKEEMDKMSEQIRRLEKDLESRLQQIQALEQERDHVRDAYEQMMAGVKSELGEFSSEYFTSVLFFQYCYMKATSGLPCASVSKRVLMQNLSYENDFDLMGLQAKFELNQCWPAVSQGDHARWGLIRGFAELTCFACQLIQMLAWLVL